MAHRDNQDDVEAAFDRYRELTGDTDAGLLHEDRTSSFINSFGEKREKTVAVYQVLNSQDGNLRGFEAFGHGAAKWGLNLFCDGVEVGMRKRKKTG